MSVEVLRAPSPMRRAWAVLAPVDAYLRRRGTAGPEPLVRDRLSLRFVEVRRRDAWQALDPALELVERTGPSGFRIFYGQVRDPADPVPVRAERAPYRLRVSSPRFQTATLTVDLEEASDMPPEVERFVLLPSAGYDFPPGNTVPGLEEPTLLRGGVFHPDGRGRREVTVDAPGYVEKDGLGRDVTGPGGQWVLPFEDGQPVEPVTVRLRWTDPADGGEIVREIPDVAVRQGATTVLPQTALRGAVVSSPAGLPVAGARITVTGVATGEPYPGEGVSDASGGWAYYFPLGEYRAGERGPRVRVTARSPAGGTDQREVQVEPGVNVTVPTFRTQEPS